MEDTQELMQPPLKSTFAYATFPTLLNVILNQLAIKRNPILAQAATALSEWIDFWRETIYIWAGWMMDLPSNPKDRLQTHM